MSKFVNPFVDQAFKRIFGREESKRLMMDFLNAVIGDKNPIVEIEYGNKERSAESDDGRTIIYDVYCRTSDGRRIIVEMQNNRQSYFKKRMVYYAAQSITDQGKKGKDWYYDFDSLYVISLLNFVDESISDRLRTEIVLMDIESNEVFLDSVRFIYLQMPLGRKSEEECENSFDYWIYILNNMESMETIPFTDKDPVLVDLLDVATLQSMSYDEQVAYDRALKRMWDVDTSLEVAKEEGIAKGRAEGEANVARNMKNLGLPAETIMLYTGLTKEQIEAL